MLSGPKPSLSAASEKTMKYGTFLQFLSIEMLPARSRPNRPTVSRATLAPIENF